FGYITLKANSDSLIAGAGTEIKAHEFHYWESTDPGTSMTAVKPDGCTWDCCHTTANMYAGFPHLYFPAEISIAERFVKACKKRGI
ncbi:MAG: cobyrinate a,c-diamide synthase, partial [Oscillospiraceae bacterium]|nr:cobyrinate a,c-diamide synthase [Oscillospiraceae bacterium]